MLCNLNRLTRISSSTNTASPLVSGFDYRYNNANQRVQTTLADGSYWVYAYDKLGQVTSGKRYWADGTPVAGQQFEYGFDEIGNRTGTKAGGDSQGANLRPASYTANRLNQYDSRTVPGAVDLIGAARGTVSVNGSTDGVYRRGEYFRKELSLDNNAGAVWQNVTVSAADGGNSISQSGSMFLPQTAESFDYDWDGNQTRDGHWDYVWDGENRLVRLLSRAGPVRRLELEYDWQGRRIRKQVFDQLSGGNRILDEKFLYDGWNLVAVVNGTNNALIRSFLWGIDLSGTTAEAGGIGGLLAVSEAGQGCYFAAYDGNGNLSVLVNGANESLVAAYEYGPFGEVIRATGPMAEANPFRFSTKYQDDESDLLYYGFRYYNSATGRWLSRDPIAESDGLHLYAFVENNALRNVDGLGLMRWSEVESLRNRMEKTINVIPCCRCEGGTSAKATLRGTASGRQVTDTVKFQWHGCVLGIMAYYWWDCFTAQREYDADPSPNKPKHHPQVWQDWGWHLGGNPQTQSETGRRGGPWDLSDSNKYNWQAAVLYVYCGTDGYYHAALALSNAWEWTWDASSKSWTSPHNGNY